LSRALDEHFFFVLKMFGQTIVVGEGGVAARTTTAGQGNEASDHTVHVEWVPAHCGIPGNERADKLAEIAAKNKERRIYFIHSPQSAGEKIHAP
jgi:hypothetical protein